MASKPWYGWVPATGAGEVGEPITRCDGLPSSVGPEVGPGDKRLPGFHDHRFFLSNKKRGIGIVGIVAFQSIDPIQCRRRETVEFSDDNRIAGDQPGVVAQVHQSSRDGAATQQCRPTKSGRVGLTTSQSSIDEEAAGWDIRWKIVIVHRRERTKSENPPGGDFSNEETPERVGSPRFFNHLVSASRTLASDTRNR